MHYRSRKQIFLVNKFLQHILRQSNILLTHFALSVSLASTHELLETNCQQLFVCNCVNLYFLKIIRGHYKRLSFTHNKTLPKLKYLPHLNWNILFSIVTLKNRILFPTRISIFKIFFFADLEHIHYLSDSIPLINDFQRKLVPLLVSVLDFLMFQIYYTPPFDILHLRLNQHRRLSTAALYQHLHSAVNVLISHRIFHLLLMYYVFIQTSVYHFAKDLSR
jgi:hypothetical protein